MLKIMRFLSRDADVTLVARFTGLTGTAQQISGIVTVRVGKTAREGGS
jgi:hypothetical protein